MHVKPSHSHRLTRIGARVLLISIGAVVFLGALCVHAQTAAPPKVRNVILMIGDGMGFPHVRLTADFTGKPLAMQELPVTGELTTRAADDAITDSAAAGTALACGKKTNVGMLGMLPDGTPIPSLAERARDAGKRVGILSSVALNNATPAAFYAKTPSRAQNFEIGVQAFASRFDILGGHSLADADGNNVHPRPGATLWQQAETAGYRILRTPVEFQSVKSGTGALLVIPNRIYVPGTPPDTEPFDPLQDMTLALMTQQSIRLLDNPKGFFLMIEGGAIDWAGHANNAPLVIAELLEFDKAVAVAQAFVKETPDTLLIVTADHETGGLTLTHAYNPRHTPSLTAQDPTTGITWKTSGHSDAHVPLYAAGPGSEHFKGVLDNTQVPIRALALMGLPPLPDVPAPRPGDTRGVGVHD